MPVYQDENLQPPGEHTPPMRSFIETFRPLGGFVFNPYNKQLKLFINYKFNSRIISIDIKELLKKDYCLAIFNKIFTAYLGIMLVIKLKNTPLTA